ncbi:MAG: hypothetical protein ACE5H0_06285 [Bacteroidota bacterium]
MAAGFRRYLTNFRRKQVARRDRNARVHNDPYWISLPSWLLAAYRRERTGEIGGTKFLNDILWAQYCLFLSVRIQDDLFDRQADSLSLIFVSDQFQVEAELAFSHYFGRKSTFWDVYRNCLQSTTRAIIRVETLQRTPRANPETLLGEYAKVSAIFKVGSAALCDRFHRMNDFSHIARFADEMAIAAQILDDLQDISEDLQRKRFNYVASNLLRSRFKKTMRSQHLKQIVRNLLYNHALDNVFTEVQHHLKLAQQAIEPLGITAAKKYVATYRDAVCKMEVDYHQQRVRLLFGPITH